MLRRPTDLFAQGLLAMVDDLFGDFGGGIFQPHGGMRTVHVVGFSKGSKSAFRFQSLL